jgi:hypothetical protein
VDLDTVLADSLEFQGSEAVAAAEAAAAVGGPTAAFPPFASKAVELQRLVAAAINGTSPSGGGVADGGVPGRIPTGMLCAGCGNLHVRKATVDCDDLSFGLTLAKGQLVYQRFDGVSIKR